MSILNNSIRCGAFTSSEIVALTKLDKKGNFDKAAVTYIQETNMERRLGRPVESESNAKPLMWGQLLEDIYFNKVGPEYRLFSQETVQHPRINFWAGSADAIKYDHGGTICDFKCPYTLKSFCNLVQPLYDGMDGMEAMNAIRANHKDGDKFYWQLISNSILHDCKFAELIVSMPYQSELEEIRKKVDGNGQYYWLYMAGENELPFLPDNGYYKNINTIRFSVPDADKLFLIEQVQKAGKLLINL